MKIASDGGFVKSSGTRYEQKFDREGLSKLLSVPPPRPDVSDRPTKSAWNDNNSESSKGDNRPHVALKS